MQNYLLDEDEEENTDIIPPSVRAFVERSKEKGNDPFTRDWGPEPEPEPAGEPGMSPEQLENWEEAERAPPGAYVQQAQGPNRGPKGDPERLRRLRGLQALDAGTRNIRTHVSMGRRGLQQIMGPKGPNEALASEIRDQEQMGQEDRDAERDELRPEERAMLESLGITVPEGVRGSQVRHLIPSITRQTPTAHQTETLEQRKAEAASRDAHRGVMAEQGERRIKGLEESRKAGRSDKMESEDRSIATDFARRPEVQEVRKTITDYADVKTALGNPNPTNDQAVLNFLPRLMGEVGNLSVSDRQAAASRMGWLNQFMDWASQGVNAKFTDERRKQMLDLADFMNESHEKVLDRAAREHSGTYGGEGGIFKDRTTDQVFQMLRPGRLGRATTQGGQQNATGGAATQSATQFKVGDMYKGKRVIAVDPSNPARIQVED